MLPKCLGCGSFGGHFLKQVVGMHIVHNERLKLRAALLNTAAGSSFTVGVLAPIAAAYYSAASTPELWTIILGVVMWLLTAVVLHLSADYILGRYANDSHSDVRFHCPPGHNHDRGSWDRVSLSELEMTSPLRRGFSIFEARLSGSPTILRCGLSFEMRASLAPPRKR